MRITNKIMQNNNLNNINGNKVLQDKLSTQMSTQKKISRPSEDPVVAIRALRLRSNVTEVTQYYSKNIPDAESWLDVTEGALKTTSAIITNMISQCTKGSNGDLTSSDREIILEQLKALRDEVYSTADVDYAGRYVFTGYRTDTTVSFTGTDKTDYSITEQLTKEDIDTFTFVKTTAEVTDADGNVSIVDLRDLDKSNYESIQVGETNISTVDVHRIRLAYSACNADTLPEITKVTGVDADGNAITETLVDPADITTVHSYDVPTAYELAAENKDKVYFIPETGELIMGEDIYAEMNALQDDQATQTANEGEIRITYSKNSWVKGDLRPEHYFACSSTDATGKQIDYNQGYLQDMTAKKQVIEYDVGTNQTIRINTTADEVYDPNIGREVDDLINSLEEVQTIEDVVKNLTSMIEAETDETKKAELQTKLDAANKAYTLVKSKMQTMFEGGISTIQGFLDSTSLAITNCGTRSSKLELIDNRMKTQKTTFETLKSENEDVDITEVAIELSSAELTYEAALMATGKVMQTTLLNFI